MESQQAIACIFSTKILLCHRENIFSSFSRIFLSKEIILWIKLSWPENPANTYAWHTETLDTCFNLEIEPATTDCSVLCKEYECNLQDTFRLIGRSITMAN